MDTESLLKSLKERKVQFGDTFAWFASLDDLIKMKEQPEDQRILKT
jgi:uncharacterized protein YdcH (DUF465 family)